MKTIFYLISILLISPSSSAFAADYYWTVPYPNTSPPPKYQSAQAACDANHQYYAQNADPHITRSEQKPMVSKTLTSFTCITHNYYINAQGNEVHLQTKSNDTIRSGDSCPSDTTYNSATGQCDGPEETDCEKRAGEQISFNRTGNAPDAFLVVIGTNYANSTLACNSGCQISVPEPKCIVKITGQYTCAGNATIMPIACPVEGGGDSFVEEAAPDVLTPPLPETKKEEEPCLYTRQADGTWSCRSSESIEADGVSCGTANGQTVCNPSQPTKDSTTIDTTVTQKNNPDGSSETTKKDQSTYVTCVGTKCDSSTTKTESKTNKDAGGNTTSTNITCDGPKCLGNNNGGPDGSGEGGGTGKCLINCGDGEGEGGSFEGAELGEVSGFGDATSQFMERIGEAPILQAVAGIGVRGSGSCSFPSVSTPVGNISFDAVCQNSSWLDPLYYVFLAMWGLAAVRTLMSA